jgi:hypothetical protein
MINDNSLFDDLITVLYAYIAELKRKLVEALKSSEASTKEVYVATTAVTTAEEDLINTASIDFEDKDEVEELINLWQTDLHDLKNS